MKLIELKELCDRSEIHLNIIITSTARELYCGCGDTLCSDFNDYEVEHMFISVLFNNRLNVLISYPQGKEEHVILATCIDWECESKEDIATLPKEITIPEEVKREYKETEDADVIGDYISDVTGYLHKGFVVEEK